MNDMIQKKIVENYYQVMIEEEDCSLEKELKWDSLDKMRFVVLLEEELQLSLDDILVKIVEAKTLKELVDCIESFLKEMD